MQKKYQHIFTPIDEAVAEIGRRRTDPQLFEAVEEYLNHDIPSHFQRRTPVLYLCRHLATPNFETLRFIEIAQTFPLPIVIGEDQKGIFHGSNSLKRALGKLPVVKGIARTHDEIIENFTVVDFSTAQGMSFNEIVTHTGGSLISLHHNLLQQIYPRGVHITDESEWIDRNSRENLLEQYRRMFTLMIIHGIMFEYYSRDEYSLVQEIVLPAFEFVHKKFGHKPLIFEFIDDSAINNRDWENYPSVVYRFLADSFKKQQPQRLLIDTPCYDQRYEKG